MIKITLNKTLAIPSIPFSFQIPKSYRGENSAWERNHPVELQT
jgi:hypothetical protein